MHGSTLIVAHAERIGAGNAFIGFLSKPIKTAKAVIQLLSDDIEVVYDLYIIPMNHYRII
jgi:hypothetical protein